MKKLLALFLIVICSVMIGGYFFLKGETDKDLEEEIEIVETEMESGNLIAEDEIGQNRMLIVKPEEKVNNEQFEIVPTMESASSAKNQVWAGAFQLVWNDFMNELVKGPIVFLQGQLPMAELLNKQMFKTKDISESAYYKKWGEVTPKLKKEIADGILDKFGERSQILDSFDFTPQPLKYFMYVMLKKDLEYEKKFADLNEGRFKGSKTPVKYFGILEGGKDIKATIKVLFYDTDENFAVTLKSKQGDLIHLYRVDTKKTLAEIYAEMKQKTVAGSKDYIKSDEKFKAPKLDFNKTQEFKELYNKPIKSYNGDSNYWEIVKAMERIQFKMDEVGAKVVAEAGMMALEKMINTSPVVHRNFLFTGPYAIFLEEPGKTPYFAAYIKDPSDIQ